MANWLRLPSGWAINFDLVVIAEGLRWTPGGLREPIPALTLIVPGGGLQTEIGDAVVPATYTLVGDDALAVWWWSRDLPTLAVPAEAREAVSLLRPGQPPESAGSGQPDEEEVPDDEPFFRLR